MCHNTDGVAISKLYCVGLFPSAEKVDLNGIKEQSLRLEGPLEPSRYFASRDNGSLPPRGLMPRAANNSARSKERLWDKEMGVVDSEGGGHCLSERLSPTLLGMAVLLWAICPFSQKQSMMYARTVLLAWLSVTYLIFITSLCVRTGITPISWVGNWGTKWRQNLSS